MDIFFFTKTWELYEKYGSDEQWREFYVVLFKELAKISPEDLIPDHLIWMKRCEKYYASIEDYERASILKQLQEAATNIFKAREILEQIKKNFYNK